MMKKHRLKPAMYSHRLNEIQDIGKEAGYAIALHGSMQRDIDVVAIPWIKDPISPDELVEKLCDYLPAEMAGTIGLRPHGRRCYTLLMGGSLFMDLSVISPREHVEVEDNDE